MISFSVLFYFSSLSNSFISLLRNTDRMVLKTTIPPNRANSFKVGSNTVFKISEAIRNSKPRSR